MSHHLDPKAGLILVKVKLYGPRGDVVVNLALDTGATWTLVSWETAVLVVMIRHRFNRELRSPLAAALSIVRG